MGFTKAWMQTVTLVTLVMVLALGTAHAAPRWAVGIGEPGNNYNLAAIQPTSDGGSVLVGYRQAPSAMDGWAAKLDVLGNITWQFISGAPGDDFFSDVCPLSDGTYFVTGSTKGFGVGSRDVWCLLLGPAGNVIWQKTYGGTQFDYGTSGRALPGGGFIVLATAMSFGSGDRDMWCLRLDASGNVIWQKTCDGAGWDARDGQIRETADGGFIIAACVHPGSGNDVIWCLKLDSAGAVSWQKAYGSYPGVMSTTIKQTLDSGYVLCVGIADIPNESLIIKLTSAGAVTWQTRVPMDVPALPYLDGICQTPEGGYVAAGSIKVGGSNDGWIVGFDENGAVVWQKSVGGASNDFLPHVSLAADGSLLFGGGSYMSSKPIALVIRSDASGDVDSSCPSVATGVVPTYPALASVATAQPATPTAAVGIDSSAGPVPTPAIGNLFCSSPAASDLAGSFSNVKFRRSKLNATFTCQNSGALPAGGFTVKVYFSTKSTLPRRATPIKTQNIGGLAAFGQSAFSIRATPTTRHKYIIAVVDSANTVAEDVETNNTVSWKFR